MIESIWNDKYTNNLKNNQLEFEILFWNHSFIFILSKINEIEVLFISRAV